jgi:hypothetical protein
MVTTDQFWIMVGQVSLLLLLGGSLLLLERLRNNLVSWWQSRRLHPLARAVMANKAVHTLLVELRAKTGADRANVYLFHNGQVFSNLNPVWRLSCTQETCKPGVTHDIERLQNILSSTIWDCLEPLFQDMKEKDKSKWSLPHVFVVDKIPEGFFKGFLTARGIKIKIVCPLLNNRRQVVGFVALNYCAGEKVSWFDGCGNECASCASCPAAPAASSSATLRLRNCQQVLRELRETTANINFALMDA